MASVWLLSKHSVKGMDVLNVTTDLLYSLEQRKKGEPVDENEFMDRAGKGQDLFRRLISGAKAQTSRTSVNDLFLLRVVEEVEKKSRLTPTEFEQKAEKASVSLEKNEIDPEAIELLEVVSDVVTKLTLRSVEGLSTSLM
jgi:hypothetical protein